jgi:hypothetical protein
MIYRTLLLLISVIITAGCTPQPSHKDIPVQLTNWEQETPESVLARIQTSASQITILSAFFNLSMNPPPDKMMSSLSGVITIDNRSTQPKVRIQAFHLFGSTLFDMVNSDITKIYVPRKKTMYIGKNTEENQQKKGPQTIFSNMMLDAPHLEIRNNSPLHINSNGIILELKDGWLDLNPQNGLVRARHKNNMVINYSAYTTLANGAFIPTKITITTKDDSFTARCTLKQLSLPKSLPVSFFDLKEYRPEIIKSLQDLQ